MSQRQQFPFTQKVPENYEKMHTQYLIFNEYTKYHNKPIKYEQLKENIKVLSFLSQSDDLLEQEIEDDQDQMTRELYQKVMQKSRSAYEKKIDLYLNNQKTIRQNNVKMDDLKLNFKNFAILSANYRQCFDSFFDTEQKLEQEEDNKILDEQRFAFQLEFNKIDEIYPGQARFIFQQLRPKVVGRKKKVETQENHEQFHLQSYKESQQMEFQEQA